MHGGGATVAEYYSAKHVALQDVIATGVYLKKYTPKSETS